MKRTLAVLSIALLAVSCSNSKIKKEDLVEKYSLNKAAAQNWEQTIPGVIVQEAAIPEWFGNESPLMNLRRTGKMSDKDLYFLEALKKIDPSRMADEDYKEFLDMLTSYVNRLPRRFFLENTNIKDPKGLVTYMVKASKSNLDNPSRYIKEVVADDEEWAKIVELSEKDDLNKKDVKKLRKLLNTFVKRDNFFNPEVWFNQEVSQRLIQIRDLNKKSTKDKIELNNINAKALFIAYPGFFSPLERWSK